MQGPTLESLISDINVEGDYYSATGAADLSDEETVTQAMEAALSQFNSVGVDDDCHSVMPEATETVDFTTALKRWTPEGNVICRIVKH